MILMGDGGSVCGCRVEVCAFGYPLTHMPPFGFLQMTWKLRPEMAQLCQVSGLKSLVWLEGLCPGSFQVLGGCVVMVGRGRGGQGRSLGPI